jgi:hypothetical protein
MSDKLHEAERKLEERQSVHIEGWINYGVQKDPNQKPNLWRVK